MLPVELSGSLPSIFNSPNISSISGDSFWAEFSLLLFFIFLLLSSEETDFGEALLVGLTPGPRVMLTFRPLLVSRPMRRQSVFGPCVLYLWPIRGQNLPFRFKALVEYWPFRGSKVTKAAECRLQHSSRLKAKKANYCQGELEGERNWHWHKIEVSYLGLSERNTESRLWKWRC